MESLINEKGLVGKGVQLETQRCRKQKKRCRKLREKGKKGEKKEFYVLGTTCNA
jgi:hypothetical protein